MVFDMIANAPGVLNSPIQWGRLQDLSSGSAASQPNPTLALNPTAFDFEPPMVSQWNLGLQRKLFGNFMYDLAYVGSKSEDLLRQVQINAVPRRRHVAAAEPGSDPRAGGAARFVRHCRPTCCGPTRATASSACGNTAATRTITRCRRA